MFKRVQTLFAFLFAFVLAFGALPMPAHATSEVGFAKSSTVERGPMSLGAVEACANKVFAPVKDGDGNLRITSMSLLESGLANLPQESDEHIGGNVQALAITRLNGCNYFVTASRGANNTFKLIAWFSGADGIERLGDTGNNNMAVTEVDIARLGYPGHNPDPEAGMTISAARLVNGAYVVVSHGVVNGAFDQKDLEMGEAASHVQVVTLPPTDPTFTNGRAIVAYRNAQGQLRLANYTVSNGGALTLAGTSGNQAGKVQDLAIAAYASNKVITAVKTEEGTLKLIPWRINDDGSITRLNGMNDPTFNNPNAGEVTEIAVTAYNFIVPDMNQYVVTAVRTAEGNLKLIAWGINGGDIVRLGDSGNLAGAATQIDVAWANNSQRIVTSLRDGDGDLRVIAWDVY